MNGHPLDTIQQGSRDTELETSLAAWGEAKALSAARAEAIRLAVLCQVEMEVEPVNPPLGEVFMYSWWIELAESVRDSLALCAT